MKRCAKVKNPCTICFDPVSNKTGLRCQGACKKWMHFQCLNYTPGKIQDIKAGLIRVNCPCPDCDAGNKEEVVVRDAGYICDKLNCPVRLPPKSCDVAQCPKNLPIPRGIEVQCPEDCPPAGAPPPPSCCIPQTCVPAPNFPPHICLPPRCQPKPTCVPCPFPPIPPCQSLAAKQGTKFQPCKTSQTNVNKPIGSQTNCPICIPPKDLSTTSSDQPSSRLSPKWTPRESPKGTPKGTPRGTPNGSPRGTPRETPRGTPRETPKGTPRETPMGTPRGTPKRTPSPKASPSPKRMPSPPCVPPRCTPKPCPAPRPCLPPKSCFSPKPPCQSPKPQYPLPRPQCPLSKPPCQSKVSLPRSCSPPRCPTTRSQHKCPQPRCISVKKDDDCSKSTCKHSVMNVPVKPLTVSRSYCMSSGSDIDSIMSAKICKGSKSECGIKTSEATRQMLLGAMEQMYNTVGNFSNQFRDLMFKMIEALEKC